ncbi:MAG TPA: sporulation protein YhbH [Selenomonadales bacterium]|nr:sporulation protein YhbH [Selenomonadales bacterium]
MAIFKDNSASQSDRSAWDRKRHRQLVEDAIKKNLGDIVAEESIIGQSKDKKVKVPVKGIREYQFIYGKNAGGVASGKGGEERGQTIGRADGGGEQGQGRQAGSDPGEDIYETEITLEELIQYLFEDLQLPDMEKKKFSYLESERKCKRSGHQRKGIPPRLDKKQSVMEKIKREQAARRNAEPVGAAGRVPFREDDLRYFRIREDVRKHSNAVVICIMDTSGSMDQTKKYLARSFYFLLYQFVRYKYENVEVVFIAHTTEAQEVSEQDFFHRGESGGTHISSGYAKALEVIEQRYSPAVWNIYSFHCSDGDNWSEDTPKAVALAKELCRAGNLFGYGEITTDAWGSSIRKTYSDAIQSANFVMATLRSKEDVWPAFKRILEKESAGGDE